MTWWMSLILALACGLAGVVVGRPKGRARSGALWGLILGPIGLFIFWWAILRDRSSAPAVRELTAEVNVPVEALVRGGWEAGTLERFRQGAEVWQGYVTFPSTADATDGWFSAQEVRRTPQ
jgi:hypothetical protein